MNYLRYIKNSLYTLLLLGLFSCAKENDNITLVFPNKVNYESFIIANHLGYFSSPNTHLEIKTVNSGIDAAEALTLGGAHIAAMGDGPAIILMSQGKDISIVSRYAKGNKIHRLISDTSIINAKQLKHKRIGIQMGSSTQIALESWLETNGLSAKDVQLIPMSPANMPEAMKNKQLDAIAGSEPWALNVEKLCTKEVHELANLENNKTHFPQLLIASNASILKNKKEIQAIITALDKANDFIAEQADSAAHISSFYIGLTAEDANKCMSRLTWEQGWNSIDSLSLEYSIQFFTKRRGTKTAIEIKPYIKISQDHHIIE